MPNAVDVAVGVRDLGERGESSTSAGDDQL